MKKLFAATAMVAALLSCAGAATAGTYQGVASHDGTSWRVTWSNVVPVCGASALYTQFRDAVAVIDDVEIDIILNEFSSNASSNTSSVTFTPSPAGTMTRLTVRGQHSFQCNGHTFLLPGYVAPAPIPTLSEWAMILLGVMLAGGAALTLQRRRQAA